MASQGNGKNWVDSQGDVKLRMHMMEDRFNMDFHEVCLLSGMEIWGDE